MKPALSKQDRKHDVIQTFAKRPRAGPKAVGIMKLSNALLAFIPITLALEHIAGIPAP